MAADLLDDLIQQATLRVNELADQRKKLIQDGQALSGAIIEAQNQLRRLAEKKNPPQGATPPSQEIQKEAEASSSEKAEN